MIFLIISLPFLSVASVIAAQDVALQASQTDAVYLLDVTSSMVGDGWKQCDRSKDILNRVLDLLLTEIERFSNGRLILITFARGPYDLDEAGPIQGMYSIEIKGNADKLILKQFIRPKEYGTPAEAPTWPGIYETVYSRTCIEGRNIGGTAIYDTILLALRELEKLQTNYPSGKEAYAASHTQEIVVFTDGDDNASNYTFGDVLDQIKERCREMPGRFRYKRYLFSDNPEAVKQAEDECKKIERAEIEGCAVQNVVAPDITQLVIIDFDRHILGFPNVWAPIPPEDSRTVTLKNIQLYYDQAKANLLEGGRLVIQPVKADDLGLPGDVAVKVKTEPADLKFPIERFDLQIVLEPFSRLKAFMDQQGKKGLQGLLRITFVKPGASVEAQQRACKLGTVKEPLIDLKQPTFPLDLPFIRPSLQASWAVERERFTLTLEPNEVFRNLGPAQQYIQVDYNESHFSLTDNENRLLGKSFSLQGTQKLLFDVRPELGPGRYQGQVKLTPSLSEVQVNDAASFEQSYAFYVIGFDRKKVVFPSLGAQPGEITGDVRTVTVELQVVGGPKDWGEIVLTPVNFELMKQGLGITVEPERLKPPFDRQTIQLALMVRPYSLLLERGDLQAQINQEPIDGYLSLEFIAPKDQLVKINPARLPVDLAYLIKQPELTVTVNGSRYTGTALDLGSLYRNQAALTIEFEANEAFQGLPESQQMVNIEFDTTHFYLTDMGGRRLVENRFNPLALKTLILKINPTLPADDHVHEGSVVLASDVKELRVNGRDHSLVIGYRFLRPAPQVTISDSLTNRDLGRIQARMRIATFEIKYNEAYAQDPQPVKVDYDEVFFELFDSRGNLVKSGSTVSINETRLELRVNSRLKAGALSRNEIATVQFVAHQSVKINGKPNDSYSYSFQLQGWLSQTLNVLKWVLLILLLLTITMFSFYSYKVEGEHPWTIAWNWLQEHWGIGALLAIGGVVLYLVLTVLSFAYADRI